VLRRCFEQRFTARRMAMDYLDIYQGVIRRHRGMVRGSGAAVAPMDDGGAEP